MGKGIRVFLAILLVVISTVAVFSGTMFFNLDKDNAYTLDETEWKKQCVAKRLEEKARLFAIAALDDTGRIAEAGDGMEWVLYNATIKSYERYSDENHSYKFYADSYRVEIISFDFIKVCLAEDYSVFSRDVRPDRNYILCSMEKADKYLDNPAYVTMGEYTVEAILSEGNKTAAPYLLMYDEAGEVYALRNIVAAVFAGSVLAVILLLIIYIVAAGKKTHDECEELVLPFELLLASAVGVTILTVVRLVSSPWINDNLKEELMKNAAISLIPGVLITITLIVAAERVACGRFIQGTLVYMLAKKAFSSAAFARKELKKSSLGAICGLILAGIIVSELIVMTVNAGIVGEGLGTYASENRVMFVFWVVERIILILFVMSFAAGLSKLSKGIYALSEGQQDYHIDENIPNRTIKEHAAEINRVFESVNEEINSRVKSERMRSELITNVSHDLKTPLTSIINYSGLIAAEKTDNPKIKEYSEVLVKQSDRIKRLIDGLIDYSKASTDNLELEPISCDMNMFVLQATGEYEDRMTDAKLSMVIKTADGPLTVSVDRKQTWRIFDNLLNNICKYSLAGSRVFIDTGEKDGMAYARFKNTSRDEIKNTGEELMERFMRGDASRSSDGNGLGLSIVKTLTELQGGKFEVDVNGDVFSAVVSFPVNAGPNDHTRIDNMEKPD